MSFTKHSIFVERGRQWNCACLSIWLEISTHSNTFAKNFATGPVLPGAKTVDAFRPIPTFFDEQVADLFLKPPFSALKPPFSATRGRQGCRKAAGAGARAATRARARPQPLARPPAPSSPRLCDHIVIDESTGGWHSARSHS